MIQLRQRIPQEDKPRQCDGSGVNVVQEREGEGQGQQQNYVGLLRAGDGYKKRAFRRENEERDREKPV